MKKILLLLSVILIVLIFSYISGYRFTSESAAEAHSFLEKDSKLVQKINSRIGDVYVYSNKDYYLTIVPERQGLLYRASSSITTKDINDKSDKVRTIGWANYQSAEKSGTIMVIEVLDDRVVNIEAGPEMERCKKKVIKGEYQIFEWNKSYFVHDINPIAFAENGEKLYVYGYNPLTPNFLDSKELRWHKVQR